MTGTAVQMRDKSVRVSHFSILLALVLAIMLLFLTASMIVDADARQNVSLAVTSTFALNGAIGFFFFCKSLLNRPFSLSLIHWLFYISMLVIAPFSQYLFGYSVWGFQLSMDDYFATHLVLTVWAGLFALFSSSRTTGSSSLSMKKFYASFPKVEDKVALRALAVSVCATTVVVTLVGVSNLFTRDLFSADLNKTMGLLFDKVVRPLPVFSFAVLLVRAKQQRKTGPAFYITLALMLIACFPAAMARYNMACIYGAVLILACAPVFEKRGLFALLFLIGFLVVFPAANAYRWETFTFSMFGEALVGSFVNLPHGFCAVDYDAYSIIARSLKYVTEIGSTNGYQLLGALLFFVPRSLWPSKPEGSGNLVCAAQGQSVLNISSPLPAEGVVNFGAIGIVIFAVIAALVCRKLDIWFIESESPLRLFYPFACLLFFFMMRGDLLSTFAFSVGYAVSFAFCLVACLGPRAAFAGAVANRGGGIARG